MATTETTPPSGGFCTRGMRNSKFLVLTGVLMIVAGIVTNTLVFFHIGYPMMAFGAFIVLFGLVRMRREKPAFMMASSSPRLAPHQMLHHNVAQLDSLQDGVPHGHVADPPSGLAPQGGFLHPEGGYPAGVYLPQRGHGFPEGGPIPPPEGYPPPQYEATPKDLPSVITEMPSQHEALLPPSYDEATGGGDGA